MNDVNGGVFFRNINISFKNDIILQVINFFVEI